MFGDKFEDPTRRTEVDKIVKQPELVGYDIQTMIKEIVKFKRQD